jgi:hypothetical protein
MFRQILVVLAGIVTASSLAGCRTLDNMDPPKFLMSTKAKAEAAERLLPARMAVFWSDAALSNPGQPAVRGFGGRVYFFNDRGEAVAPDGQFTVYAFDDSRQDGSDRVPEKKFAFTPEQFKQHMGKSTLGPSFSIWIPWDEQGGEQREITLLPIFTTTSGQFVKGEQSTNVLPGKKRHADDIPAYSQTIGQSEARQVGHWESAAEEDRGETGMKPAIEMRTTTIAMPQALAQRLSQSPPQRIEPRLETMPAQNNFNSKPPNDGGAAQTARPASISAPWSPRDPRLNRFLRPRSQALGEPLVPPNRERMLVRPTGESTAARAPDGESALPMEIGSHSQPGPTGNGSQK